MKIYLASSWRNAEQPEMVQRLRANGHKVYDFRNPTEGDKGFSWKEITSLPTEKWTTLDYLNALETPEANRGFQNDAAALQCCEVCILLLPCGKSAHLELGWAVGAGKKTAVLLPAGWTEPELMYKFCDIIAPNLDTLNEWLNTLRIRNMGYAR